VNNTLTGVRMSASQDVAPPVDIEPAPADPVFDALIRTFEVEGRGAKRPHLAPIPSPRRDPYYLD
jgi:hypothetical protein